LLNKSKGAYLIIHEVLVVSDKQMQNPFIKSLLDANGHTTPEQAGTLFSKVQPKMAAYTHILLLGVSEEELVTKTRKTYSGPLVIGDDLMTFEVDEEVTIVKK